MFRQILLVCLQTLEIINNVNKAVSVCIMRPVNEMKSDGCSKNVGKGVTAFCLHLDASAADFQA